MTQYRPKSRATGWMAMVLVTTLLLSGCLGSGSSSTEAPASGQDSQLTLEVWHTFAAESKEKACFAIHQIFEEQHPNITVEVALVPFGMLISCS